MKRQVEWSTDRPGEALVLGDVSDVERQHGVSDILSIQVINLSAVTVPEKKNTKFRSGLVSLKQPFKFGRTR